MLLVVLYGFEMWPFTLREEDRLKTFKRVLRSLFGPERGEVT
jgi:hypothetical protein